MVEESIGNVNDENRSDQKVDIIEDIIINECIF